MLILQKLIMKNEQSLSELIIFEQVYIAYRKFQQTTNNSNNESFATNHTDAIIKHCRMKSCMTNCNRLRDMYKVTIIWIQKAKISLRNNVFAELKAISFQIFNHDAATLNSNQFRSLTFVSYEYNSRTKTVADAFWKKTSKSWSKSVDIVKLSRMQLLQSQCEYIDFDISRAKSLHHNPFRAHWIEKISRFYYL